MRRFFFASLFLLFLAGFGFYIRPVSIFSAIRDARLAWRGVESQEIQTRQYRLHYLSEGRGRPLVILPGLLSTAADAAPLMATFAQKRRVIALDMLGQGKSDKPDIGYSIADQSAAVIGFLDRARLGTVDLLGVSLGGWVALDVAARRPDLVRRLILADSGGLRFETSLTPETFAPQTPEQLRALLAIQSVKPPPDIPGFIARDVLRTLKASEWIPLRAARSMISWRHAYDGRLASVRVPTLVYWGREDRVIPLDVGERLAAGIADARLVVANDCGHLAVLECKGGFVKAVNAFLEN